MHQLLVPLPWPLAEFLVEQSADAAFLQASGVRAGLNRKPGLQA
jgi:hypothetical protein